jgi:hypothetical protein
LVQVRYRFAGVIKRRWRGARQWPERALELAWDSFCGHTTPAGAVVLNSSGVIVVEGRGRRYEKTGPPRR